MADLSKLFTFEPGKGPTDNKPNTDNTHHTPSTDSTDHTEYAAYKLQKHREQDQAAAVEKTYKRQQEAIKNSEDAQRELIAAINKGEDMANIILKALEVISLATGNPMYNTAVKDNFLKLYGVMREKPVLAIQIKETERRLNLLQEANKNTNDPNIAAAIRADLAEVKRLKGLLS